MGKFNYEIKRKIATLCEESGYTKEVNLIRFNDNDTTLDIRRWDRNKDIMQKGISLTKAEVEKLKEALNQLEW